MKTLLRRAVPFLARPLLSRIHRYRDAHRGESCYLIGDGVSVKWFDLGAFAGKTAIPCAFLPFHRDFARLDVRYLSLQEPWVFYPWRHSIDGRLRLNSDPVIAMYRSYMRQNHGKQFFVNLSNAPMLWSRNVIFTFRNFHDETLPENFLTRRTEAFEGSLRFSIALAIYLGFEDIFLVGYDYTHERSRRHHWYERGQGVLQDFLGYNREFFGIAQEYADITAITIDGGAKFIRSVTYEQHTGRKPVYRENTELMEERYLRVLATWPGYNIY